MNETTQCGSGVPVGPVTTPESEAPDLEVRTDAAIERLRRAAALYVERASGEQLLALANGVETDDEDVAQTEDIADNPCGVRREPPLRVMVQSESKKEYPQPPKGSYYPRPGDKHQGYCPENWDEALLVYPRGSLKVLQRAGHWLTSEQWEKAVELLEEGRVVGFSIRFGESADLACRVADKCGFQVQAVEDGEGGEQVYFCRWRPEAPSE